MASGCRRDIEPLPERYFFGTRPPSSAEDKGWTWIEWALVVDLMRYPKNKKEVSLMALNSSGLEKKIYDVVTYTCVEFSWRLWSWSRSDSESEWLRMCYIWFPSMKEVASVTIIRRKESRASDHWSYCLCLDIFWCQWCSFDWGWLRGKDLVNIGNRV